MYCENQEDQYQNEQAEDMGLPVYTITEETGSCSDESDTKDNDTESCVNKIMKYLDNGMINKILKVVKMTVMRHNRSYVRESYSK